MTTYQDPPLQSRRAARQGERGDAGSNAMSAAPSTSNTDESVARAIAAGTAEPLNYATSGHPPLSSRPRDFSPEGRGAVTPSWAPQYGGVSADGALEFQTQAREPAPVSSAAAAEPDSAHQQANGAAPLAARDVSPSAEYTMTRRELRALREAGLITDVSDLSQPITLPEAAALSAAAAAHRPTAFEPEPEAAMAEEGRVAKAQEAEPIPLVSPAPHPSSRLDSALAEFDVLAAAREAAAPAEGSAHLPGRRAATPPVVPFAEPEPVSQHSTEGLSAFDALFQPPSTAIPVIVATPTEQQLDAAAASDVFANLIATPMTKPAAAAVSSSTDSEVVEAEIVEPEPEPGVESASSPAAFLFAPPPPVVPLVDPLLTAPAPQGAPSMVPPPPSAAATPFAEPAHVAPGDPNVGHWSIQSDIDDAEQGNSGVLSRSVGAGTAAITTSALVLPSIPDHAIGGPLGEGGQILLTGSFALPDSLSALGAHPDQLDQPDIDHLLDPGDHQVASTDSTPVRAIRAVSTHTASGGIISPTKPKGTRGFTILIIAASVMAVVVVGLLVAGLLTGTL